MLALKQQVNPVCNLELQITEVSEGILLILYGNLKLGGGTWEGKRKQSKALLNFEPFLGARGPFSAEESSLALLTLLMDIVAPWAYLV